MEVARAHVHNSQGKSPALALSDSADLYKIFFFMIWTNVVNAYRFSVVGLHTVVRLSLRPVNTVHADDITCNDEIIDEKETSAFKATSLQIST